MDSSQLSIHLNHFVKSKEASSISKDDDRQDNRRTVSKVVCGSATKEFYDSIIRHNTVVNSNKNKCEKRKSYLPIKSKTVQSKTKKNVDVNRLMKAVETKNTNDLVRLLEENDDAINLQDQYGWTPMMSACCSGAISIVKLLLQWNPDLSLNDKKGNTCRTLAATKGYFEIIELLNAHMQQRRSISELETPPTSETSEPSNQSFYCKTCKQIIENASYKKHSSSTIHLFNAAPKNTMPTMYSIPETNKGFQILLKVGWNKEEGLGPAGEGHKYPPKTILKQDRTGLGAKQYKARVTHILDAPERKAKPKSILKRDFKSEKRNERRKERNIRQMLS